MTGMKALKRIFTFFIKKLIKKSKKENTPLIIKPNIPQINRKLEFSIILYIF